MILCVFTISTVLFFIKCLMPPPAKPKNTFIITFR